MKKGEFLLKSMQRCERHKFESVVLRAEGQSQTPWRNGHQESHHILDILRRDISPLLFINLIAAAIGRGDLHCQVSPDRSSMNSMNITYREWDQKRESRSVWWVQTNILTTTRPVLVYLWSACPDPSAADFLTFCFSSIFDGGWSPGH